MQACEPLTRSHRLSGILLRPTAIPSVWTLSHTPPTPADGERRLRTASFISEDCGPVMRDKRYTTGER